MTCTRRQIIYTMLCYSCMFKILPKKHCVLHIFFLLFKGGLFVLFSLSYTTFRCASNYPCYTYTKLPANYDFCPPFPLPVRHSFLAPDGKFLDRCFGAAFSPAPAALSRNNLYLPANDSAAVTHFLVCRGRVARP